MSIVSPNPQFFECGENPQDALFNVDRLNQGMSNNRDLASQLQGQTRPMRDAPMPSVFMSAVLGFIDDKDYEDSTGGNYTDCRYWVKIKGLFPKTTDPKFEIKDENFFTMGSPKKITAVNLMEVTANSHSMAVGTPVMAYPVAPRDGVGIFNWVLIPLGTGLFPVIVKKVSGAAGSSSAYCTWAYELYAQSDTSLAHPLNTTALQPKRSPCRMVKIAVTAATDGAAGVAYFDKDGAIQLWDCVELAAGQDNC